MTILTYCKFSYSHSPNKFKIYNMRLPRPTTQEFVIVKKNVSRLPLSVSEKPMKKTSKV